jgi:pimeloyl-ACP methyl ester carboxylesterase
VERVAIQTSDGRHLRVYDAGDPAGPAILYQHGTPSSGLLDEVWIEDARARGARLVGFDRPGYGGSTERPGRSVADVAGDVAAILDGLGIDRCATWGISGGGPHALACAALLPDRIAAVATLASVAPYYAEGLDWLEGMGEGNHREFGAAREGGEPLDRLLTDERDQMMAAGPDGLVDAMRPHLSAVDAAFLTGRFARWLYEESRAGIGESIAGWRDDDYAFLAPWGFELSSIRAPALLRQGSDDLMVPPSHGRWLVERIPGVEAVMRPEDGHLTMFGEVPTVHGWLLERL